MASPWSAAALAAWRGYSADRRALVKVEITDPSPLTLYLATAETRTPDGQLWLGIITEIDVIEAPGEHLSPGFDACSGGFRIPPVPFGYQTGGADAFDTLVTHRWIGATVSFYLWTVGLSSISDLAPVLLNSVVEDFELDARGMHVLCVQRRLTNQSITPSFVQRHTYPKAPDKSFGLPLPIVIGDGRSPPLRGDWDGSNHNVAQQRFAMRGGIIPASPCVIVDQGQGGGLGKARVLVAGHPVQSVLEASNLGSLAMRSKSGDIALLDVPSGDIFTGAASGFDFDDANAYGYVFLPFMDIEAQANQGDNARHLLDISEYPFARLDWDASKRAVKLNLGSVANLGPIVDMRISAGYKTNSSVDAGQQIEWVNNGVGTTFLNHAAGMPASTTPTSTLFSIGAPGTGNAISAAQATLWDFSNIDIFFRFKTPGTWTGAKIDLYWLGVIVQYRPKGDLIRIDRVPNPRFGMPPPGISERAAKRWNLPKAPQFIERPTIAVDGDFFAQPRGWDDTTVTGGSSPVERPCDIVWLILKQYLGLTTLVEQTSGVHGNFVDARAKLLTFKGTDMRYFRAIVEAVDIHPLLQDLARQSASWWLLNRFTDRYIWHVWEAEPAAATYDRPLEPEDMVAPGYLELNTDGAGAVVSAVRVSFLYDASRRQAISSCAVGPDGSTAGYEWMDVRDEYLTVVSGANDKLDVSAGTVTLNPGDYSPAELMAEGTARLNALDPGVKFYQVVWGFTIIAGLNDKIDFSDGSTRVATVTPGAYTPAGLAAEIATQMNSVSSGISASYDATTRKFTISKSSGTLTLKIFTGANVNVAVWQTLGFYVGADKFGSLSYTADSAREQDRFSIGRVGGVTTDLLWETGANGLNGTRQNCAELFGFLTIRDKVGGQTSFMGDSPKNNRETRARLVRSRYGGKRELTIDGNWIRDSATAREVRNRIFDLSSEPKVRVRFESIRVPDLERGKLIAFSSNFDRYFPFPKTGSDGSWGGKLFYVVDVRQNCGPDRWDTEVLAVEASDAAADLGSLGGWGLNYGLDWGPD